MEIIRNIVDLTINNTKTVSTVQYFDETEDKVTIDCAEYVPEFTRGLTCNIKYNYKVCSAFDNDERILTEEIKDLVLVYIKRTFEISSLPVNRYIFFK